MPCLKIAGVSYSGERIWSNTASKTFGDEAIVSLKTEPLTTRHTGNRAHSDSLRTSSRPCYRSAGAAEILHKPVGFTWLESSGGRPKKQSRWSKKQVDLSGQVLYKLQSWLWLRFGWQEIGRAKRDTLFKECADRPRSRLQKLMIEMLMPAMWIQEEVVTMCAGRRTRSPLFQTVLLEHEPRQAPDLV